MSSKRRVYRVAEQIQILIAQALQRVADPRFGLVTITSAVVSPDLRVAKVFWVVSGDQERRDEVAEAFESAKGLFRRSLGKELGLRVTPELVFFYDNTLDTRDEIEELLSRARARDEGPQEHKP